MSNFLDRFFPDKKNNSWKGNTNKSSNPIASFFNNIAGSSTSSSSFSGTGQSLGGNSKPGIIIPITLHEEGTLGIQIEKASSNQIAIVSMVIPNSQADKANIIRGDVLCYPDTNGMEEIQYDIFLELAKSQQRPLSFDVRRIVTPSSLNGKRKGNENDSTGTNATNATIGSAGTTSTKSTPANNTLSAEAYARKQAIIAAAEKREREHQKKYNTTSSSGSKSTTTLKPLLSTVEKNKLEQERQQRIQDQSKEIQAAVTSNVEYVQQIKQMEQQTATQLGYNPYISQSVSSGQARTAVTTTTHGTIQAPTITTKATATATATKASDNTTSRPAGPGRVSAPASIPSADDNNNNNTTIANATTALIQPSLEFQQAFETLVTSTADTSIVINTMTILRKLIINATTKGLDTATSDNEKYRKIRFMNNIKIRTSITDIPGAIDILLSIGFQIHEEYNIELNDQESVLLFPITTIVPPWLSSALLDMEQYVTNHPTK